MQNIAQAIVISVPGVMNARSLIKLDHGPTYCFAEFCRGFYQGMQCIYEAYPDG